MEGRGLRHSPCYVASSLHELVYIWDDIVHLGEGEEGHEVAGVSGDKDEDDQPPGADNEAAAVCIRHHSTTYNVPTNTLTCLMAATHLPNEG